MAVFSVTAEIGFDMERMNLHRYWDGGVQGGTLVEMSNTTAARSETLYLVGEGFTARPSGWFPGGGTVQRVVYDARDGSFMLEGLNRPVVDFLIDWDDTAAATALRETLLAGNDEVRGQVGADRLRGYAGDDVISGYFGDDDLHGNAGDDTVAGEWGNDWVVGGQGRDVLAGGDGDDLLLGNLGSDTADGGAGRDTLLGGQGDDLVRGGAGRDHLFGDLGSDTQTGGEGGDVFHIFLEDGRDVITDFDYAAGDRIQVDGDVDFRAERVGDDVLVTLTYGTVGVPATSQVLVLGAGANLGLLPEGWISHAADVWM